MALQQSTERHDSSRIWPSDCSQALVRAFAMLDVRVWMLLTCFKNALRRYLYNNQLSGSITEQLGNLIALEQLSVTNWSQCFFPFCLSKIHRLCCLKLLLLCVFYITHSALSNNQLNGSIATEFGRLTALKELWGNFSLYSRVRVIDSALYLRQGSSQQQTFWHDSIFDWNFNCAHYFVTLGGFFLNFHAFLSFIFEFANKITDIFTIICSTEALSVI